MPADAILEAERVARLKATPWEIGADLYYHAPAAVRALLERMLGAPGGSVAIVAGTSAGIGIAARGLPLRAGHEVLLLEYQFPSNAWPWRAVEARGATVRVAPRPLGSDPTAAILQAIGPATRVVAIDWVNYVDGAVVDLRAVGAACRERGIWFVVDAAQGLGALTVDVAAAGIDLLAAPSHKWLLGPDRARPRLRASGADRAAAALERGLAQPGGPLGNAEPPEARRNPSRGRHPFRDRLARAHGRGPLEGLARAAGGGGPGRGREAGPLPGGPRPGGAPGPRAGRPHPALAPRRDPRERHPRLPGGGPVRWPSAGPCRRPGSRSPCGRARSGFRPTCTTPGTRWKPSWRPSDGSCCPKRFFLL